MNNTMKTMVFILLISLITSCHNHYDLNQIGTLSSQLIDSKTASEEAQVLEKMLETIAKNGILVETYYIDINNKRYSPDEHTDLTSANKVGVILSKADQTYSFEWNPIIVDNVFILFRE